MVQAGGCFDLIQESAFSNICFQRAEATFCWYWSLRRRFHEGCSGLVDGHDKGEGFRDQSNVYRAKGQGFMYIILFPMSCTY